jgi:hypothetical protein
VVDPASALADAVSVDRSSCVLASFSHVHALPRILLRVVSAGCALGAAGAGCHTPTIADTVDLGDHADTPEIALDEDTFHCVIQPLVITQYGCARGMGGESGSCHAAKSALRLIEVPSPASCQGGRVIGEPPAESVVNLEAVRTSVGLDAESSPLYRRPLGLDSHPRTIFGAGSAQAGLLRAWLDGASP